MEQDILFINILVAILAGVSVLYILRIWLLTRYSGMFWLTVSTFYMLALRIVALFGVDIIHWAIGFWIGFAYAMGQLYRQTRGIIKE